MSSITEEDNKTWEKYYEYSLIYRMSWTKRVDKNEISTNIFSR